MHDLGCSKTAQPDLQVPVLSEEEIHRCASSVSSRKEATPQ